MKRDHKNILSSSSITITRGDFIEGETGSTSYLEGTDPFEIAPRERAYAHDLREA
jgi:hypothetical protein